MMEITPHLKTVLKNYQHSATKSLQGPGLSLIPAKKETGPDIKDDLDYVQPQPFPIQQSPILTSADKTSSERLDTILEGEPISCFVVGGEKRLCLPQVLNYVLRDFNVDDINLECDNLQIYCSLCTDEQVIVLKNQRIIPSSAHSCGLITKTDAERLCSALLHDKKPVKLSPRKDALRFKIYHECFGKCRGFCVPEMYTSKKARCIECVDCQGWFSPQQFVSHVHMNLENRTVHWGFESTNWRSYLVISEDQHNYEQYKKYLDKMKEQYDGKTPFTHIHHIGDYTNHKRKMMHHEVLIKQEEIPLKKNKREEYIPLPLATLPPVYLQYVQNQFLQTPSMIQFQQFKHFPSLKETKLRQTIALNNNNRFTAPQTVQYPDRAAQTERLENSYQPNVALAPPTPKKHRYIKSVEQAVVQEVTSSVQKGPPTPTTVIKIEKPDPESHKNVMQKSPDSQNIIDSTVSVVQSTGNLTRYNSEIELSTDTDDTASETSEKQCTDVNKMEEVLKNVDMDVKEVLLKLFKKMAKEREDTIQESREKDNKIRDLEIKLANLEKRFNTPTPPIITQNGICDTHNHSTDVAECEATPPPTGGRLNTPTPHADQNRTPTQTPALDNSNVGSEENDSSVINTNKVTEELPPPQKSVITTLESEAIKLTTAPPPE